MMTENVQLNEQQFVVLDLNGELYAVEIERVQEIYRMEAITAVPHAPAGVEGIINLRGRVTPVVNLRQCLGIARSEATPQSRIVLARAGEGWIGLIVDGVSQVLRIPAAAIEPPPAMVGGAHAGLMRGIAKVDRQLVILLDLNQIVDQVEAILPTGAATA
jgi:purine-binding chemotaxis protein CheW